jgi:aryl-alcohol dehydrogenase-like predicted oxidoreductase
MEYRKLGRTGVDVSAVGLGGWEIGGGYGDVDDSEYQRAVHRAVDVGINCFDTAWSYGAGKSERALSRALGHRRQKVIIATKFGVGYEERFRDASYQRAMRSIEESLRNLQTDYIDVYLVHWPDPETPLEETVRALEDIVEQGKARFVGVSNFHTMQLEQCLQTRRIDVAQYCWNMLDRRAGVEVFPLCEQNGIGVMAYGPLAYGILTGTFTPETKFAQDDWRSQEGRVGTINLFQHLFDRDHFPKNLRAVGELRTIAAAYGKSLPQLALNWCLSHAPINVALVGCRNIEEVNHSLGALEWSIRPHDFQIIDDIFLKNGAVTTPEYWIDSGILRPHALSAS